MNLKVGAMIGALVLLTACGPKGEVTTSEADMRSAEAAFDAAVQNMTVAYFSLKLNLFSFSGALASAGS